MLQIVRTRQAVRLGCARIMQTKEWNTKSNHYLECDADVPLSGPGLIDVMHILVDLLVRRIQLRSWNNENAGNECIVLVC